MCAVEGIRQPVRDRGDAVLDSPSPGGHRGVTSHLQPREGAQLGPAWVLGAAKSGVMPRAAVAEGPGGRGHPRRSGDGEGTQTPPGW